MAGMKKVEKPELVETGLQSEPSTKLAEQNVASGKDGIPSDFASSKSTSGGATSLKGVTNQESGAEQGVYCPPTSCYNYYYPGYGGASTQMDDGGYFHVDGSYAGVQSDNGSMVYYMPGYNPYSAGNHMGVDGQSVGQQQYFSSSGYLQHPVSYGTDAVPCYPWDSSFVGDAPNGSAANLGNAKYGPGRTASSKSNGSYSMKTNGTAASRLSTLPLGSKSHHSAAAASSNYSKSFLHSQPLRSSNKVSRLGSEISGGLVNGPHPAMMFSSTSHKEGPFLYNGAMNYRQNSRTWSGNDRIKLREKSNGNGELESANELTCGPRASIRSATLNLSGEKEELGFAVRRDQYNLQDFQTDYDSAKFYIIKSYNEDNIHRCVKYGVWSSTPNGNKKLDASFRNTESKAIETEKRCPIFLFFSVNGSGQFVGLAEMTGPVDFNKDMDFWQLDKWSGFFPVQWHIIKDIPNSQLRHIILENNDNKPVTYTRDTQEVQLKQGLEMLNIFKSYSEKTSILDDFRFYETREKSNIAKKSTKPTPTEMEIYHNDEFGQQQIKAGERKVEDDVSAMNNQTSDPTSSLIGLAKNLSLNDRLSKSSAAMHSGPPSNAF